MHWPLVTLGLTVLLIGGLLYVVFQLLGGIIRMLFSKTIHQNKLMPKI